MKAAVVDASVVVKWAVPEDHSEAALTLLTDGIVLHAPGHWLAEVSTALWAKSALKGILTRQQAVARMEWIGDLDVHETSIKGLMATATGLAFDLHLTVYDTLYLALAKQTGVPLVTADRRLYEKSGMFPDLVVWVADLVTSNRA